jgi:RNA polymerase sigma-54 factor
MRTGLSQQTSLRQDLRINPRLYQAMDMLYMPMIDLQQHLKQELLINPFLELLEPEEEEPQDQQTQEKNEKEEAKKDDETDWEEILLNGFEVGGMKEQYEEREYIEPVTVEIKDLDDHLREQLKLMELTPRQILCPKSSWATSRTTATWRHHSRKSWAASTSCSAPMPSAPDPSPRWTSSARR